MRNLLTLLLLLALLLFASCTPVAKEQSPQASSPVPQGSMTPKVEPSHPNQVAVSIGKTSPEIARLNPRLVEGYYLPEGMGFVGEDFVGFSTTPKKESGLPPPGMKWLVVIVELDGTQEEVSVPLNKIRIVDQSYRTYKLSLTSGFTSGGDSDSATFTDLRTVLEATITNRSPTASQWRMVFAVASKAQGLTLEF